MKVVLVPSSIAAHGEEASQYLISYLINDTLAIDAGSLGVYGTPFTQARIKHVLLSHSHNDHTATLPVFVENAYEARSDCVTIHASEAVLSCLKQDVFNGRIWPDFIAMSSPEAPFLRLERLEPGVPVVLEGLKITPIPVDHVVPTLGFLVEEPRASILIASDTGPTDELWKAANAAENLKAVFLEAAFPNAMGDLARLSMHLTPALFGLEARKLKHPVTIVAVHIKPRYRDQILSELRELVLPNLVIGEFGKAYEW
jgi:ribonuclease BN (tRNA processing enzyme)